MASLHFARLPFNINFRRGKTPGLPRCTSVKEPLRNPLPNFRDKNQFPGKLEADVVVIGSGIGGLCCAGLLAKYNQDVIVLESHDVPGGAAHSFEIKGYKFDSGPSLFSGFQSRGPQANPLAQVLDALGENVPCASYNSWMVYIPEGEFLSRIGPSEFYKDLDTYVGPEAVQEWKKLLVYMFAEWYKKGCLLEYPIHGTGSVVGVLVQGIQKFGGRLALNAHVKRILVKNGRATGVELSSGSIVKAKKAVVSNASMLDTLNLLPPDAIPTSYTEKIKATPQCESFMHLHLGFDAQIVPENLGIHHIVVNDWSRGVDAEQNVVLISIPSVLGKELAPSGKHVLHAYTPGTEPYSLWEGLDRRSAEYKRLKAERSEVMWKAVERVLGSGFIREKCEVALVGTPLTHKRFLRRHRGTYGPAIKAGEGTFPGHSTPLPQLFCCGDSTFPGIGVPAVAASGAIVANTLVPVSKHYELLNELGI
ncbi:prolycopene isomerase, chloroplastic isoform X4 [Dendrobium catenatum]|uniref:prolycopene isomerase, chloroplastic isoform X4 n=1 Tax=Dendrobium catenatum TaxID=906689 RepID=UPI0009F5A3F5|nr:prolycopene isomerase, chloroplastic isoform X4 [Dendrobium catenatum]